MAPIIPICEDRAVTVWTETAFAKINLALHVRRRRDDGYHELETLFAFVDQGDGLSIALSDDGRDNLTIKGRFGGGLDAGPDNLVLRALAFARTLDGPEIPPLAVYLDKNLPVASGVGGGSADAAALLRIVHSQWRCDWALDALASASMVLGADVPACVMSQTCRGTGIGEKLALLPGNDLDGAPVLLVNSGIAVPTGPVFRAWDGLDRGALADQGPLSVIMHNGRNDLQHPALSLFSDIQIMLDALSATQPILARMSGSGATCFAIYETLAARDTAASIIADAHPDWWQIAGTLRG